MSTCHSRGNPAGALCRLLHPPSAFQPLTLETLRCLEGLQGSSALGSCRSEAQRASWVRVVLRSGRRMQEGVGSCGEAGELAMQAAPQL